MLCVSQWRMNEAFDTFLFYIGAYVNHQKNRFSYTWMQAELCRIIHYFQTAGAGWIYQCEIE